MTNIHCTFTIAILRNFSDACKHKFLLRYIFYYIYEKKGIHINEEVSELQIRTFDLLLTALKLGLN